MGVKLLAHSSRAPSSDDPVHAPVGQEQVTLRIDVADVAPHSSFTFSAPMRSIRPCLFLATDQLRHVRRCHVEGTKSGILNEKLKADADVDALTAWLNFKF